MRYTNVGRILELVAVTELIFVITLPRCSVTSKTSNDVISEDLSECDEPTEGGLSPVGQRVCNRNRVQANGAGVPLSNDTLSEANRQLWVDRLRRREIRRMMIHFHLQNARRNILRMNGSSPGFPANPQDITDVRDFQSLLQQADEPDETLRGDQELPNLYLPQCSGPQNFSGRWNDGTNFRLYFQLDATEWPHDTKVTSAFLYLWRKPASNKQRTAVAMGRTGRQGGGGSEGGGSRWRRSTRSTSEVRTTTTPGGGEEKGEGHGEESPLKVTIYAFSSRPNRRNRQEVKSVIRNLISQPQATGWIRINLTKTVEEWIRRPLRNLGLQVTVGNESNLDELLRPADYFEVGNCLNAHGWSSDQPGLEESVGHHSGTESATDTNLTRQPFLQVFTAEVQRPKSRHHRHDPDSIAHTIRVDSDASSAFRDLLSRSRSMNSRMLQRSRPTIDPSGATDYQVMQASAAESSTNRPSRPTSRRL